MRYWIIVGTALIAACSTETEHGDAPAGGALPTQEEMQGEELAPGFAPPPAPEGYMRIVAPVLKSLPPGTDISHCQYVRAPFDRDVDVLHVQGHQSAGGHHAIAYASTVNVPIGTSRTCNDDDNLSLGFIGGIGGEAGGGVELPPGVAFRLPKGSSIMLNTHFLNVTDKTIDGHSVLDLEIVPADGERTIAAFFANGNFGFNLPPRQAAEAVAECSVPRDMQFILFTNHMHDYGSSAKTELVRTDGTVELVHEDPHWTYEMQFKAVYSKWSLDDPLRVAKGETLRTRCRWQNSTDAALSFPREMCFGVGFFLSDGSSAPVCLDGAWRER